MRIVQTGKEDIIKLFRQDFGLTGKFNVIINICLVFACSQNDSLQKANQGYGFALQKSCNKNLLQDFISSCFLQTTQRCVPLLEQGCCFLTL